MIDALASDFIFILNVIHIEKTVVCLFLNRKNAVMFFHFYASNSSSETIFPSLQILSRS